MSSWVLWRLFGSASGAPQQTGVRRTVRPWGLSPWLPPGEVLWGGCVPPLNVIVLSRQSPLPHSLLLGLSDYSLVLCLWA